MEVGTRWLEQQADNGCLKEGRRASERRRCAGLGRWLNDGNFTAKMSDDEQEQTIAEDLVVTKYKMGGDIANREFLRITVWMSCPRSSA